MDGSRFDQFVRRWTTPFSRRTALGRSATTAFVALTSGSILADSARPVAAKPKAKGCGKNQQRCKGKCIRQNQCCRAADCTGAKAGACVRKQCQPAFTTCTNAEGTVRFVKDAPGKAPLGQGAARFTVGPAPAVDDWAHLRNADYAGAAIADITKLEYAVYVRPLVDTTCPDLAPYLAIYADAGGTDHILVSTTGRDPVDCNRWQVIDAAAGEWWMPTDPGFAPQNDPKTLAEIATQHPGIVVRNAVTTDPQCPDALGGLRLEAGEWPGGGGTGIVEVYASYLKVAIGEQRATFRF